MSGLQIYLAERLSTQIGSWIEVIIPSGISREKERFDSLRLIGKEPAVVLKFLLLKMVHPGKVYWNTLEEKSQNHKSKIWSLFKTSHSI